MKLSGTVSRVAKSGLQVLEQEGVWFNRGFRYAGPTFDTLKAGDSVELDITESGQNKFINSLNLLSISSTSNGGTKSNAEDTKQHAINKAVVVKAVLDSPVLGALINKVKTLEESFILIVDFSTAVELYLMQQGKPFSQTITESLNKLEVLSESNGK